MNICWGTKTGSLRETVSDLHREVAGLQRLETSYKPSTQCGCKAALSPSGPMPAVATGMGSQPWGFTLCSLHTLLLLSGFTLPQETL